MQLSETRRQFPQSPKPKIPPTWRKTKFSANEPENYNKTKELTRPGNPKTHPKHASGNPLLLHFRPVFRSRQKHRRLASNRIQNIEQLVVGFHLPQLHIRV